MDGAFSAWFIHLFDFFFNRKTTTFGDVLEKLRNKTPTGNTPLVLEDTLFFHKGRWEHSFFCYHSQKTVLSEHCGQLL